MMAERQSRRLRGFPAEIETIRFRCFCLEEGDACEIGVMQLPCCHQFLPSEMLPTMAANQSRYLPDVPRPTTSTICTITTTTNSC